MIHPRERRFIAALAEITGHPPDGLPVARINVLSPSLPYIALDGDVHVAFWQHEPGPESDWCLVFVYGGRICQTMVRVVCGEERIVDGYAPNITGFPPVARRLWDAMFAHLPFDDGGF